MPDSAFDAWYNEIEGFALRAERLTGPRDELMAAFEAGVEAERVRCAKVADEYGKEAWGLTEEEHAANAIAAAIRNPPEQPAEL